MAHLKPRVWLGWAASKDRFGYRGHPFKLRLTNGTDLTTYIGINVDKLLS